MKTEYYTCPQFYNGEKSTDTVYSDRIFQWDHNKHDILCKKHFENIGQYWGNRSAEKIESFLSEYIGKPIRLCRVEELENKSNGYPYWRFDYYIIEDPYKVKS